MQEKLHTAPIRWKDKILDVRHLYTSDLGRLSELAEDSSATERSSDPAPGKAAFATVSERGELLGFFDGDRLAAAGGFLRAADMPDSFLSDSGCCANSGEAFAVSFLLCGNDFRGSHLGSRMLELIVERALSYPNSRFVLAEVSPLNYPALSAFMRLPGFRIVSLKQRGRCRLRYMLSLDRLDCATFTDFQRLSFEDLLSVSRALENDYTGLTISGNSEKKFIWMAK